MSQTYDWMAAWTWPPRKTFFFFYLIQKPKTSCKVG